MAKGTFVTAINCMDGRVQEPVISWMKKELKADHVDMITEPGPDQILAEGPYLLIGSIIDRVRISLDAHGSKVIAIVAHHDCAGNPVSKDEHMAHLEQCVDEIGSWAPEVRIISLWVNKNWNVKKIYDSEE